MFFSQKPCLIMFALAAFTVASCGGTNVSRNTATTVTQELGRFECSVQSATCFGVEWDRVQGREIHKLVQNQRAANSRNDKGETPLHWAARFGGPYIVQHLLDSGASPESRSRNGQTPLHWAALNRDPGVAELILSAGRTIHNARDKFGRTALHMAVVKNSNPNVITMLMRWCVDPFEKDEKERLAYDLIKENEELINTDAYWIMRDVVEQGEIRKCEAVGLPQPKRYTLPK